MARRKNPIRKALNRSVRKSKRKAGRWAGRQIDAAAAQRYPHLRSNK